MPGAAGLVDIGLGILAGGGAAHANRSNARMAREQMRFQERMSSTAAQRAVKDFQAAGLNPALAYGNTASSPGGASTTFGNPAGDGIATAQAARRQRQEMEIARDLAHEQRGLLRAQREAATSAALASHNQALLTWQEMEFRGQTQPYMTRQQAAEALLREAAIPGAQNEAKVQQMLGTWAPAIRAGMGTAAGAARIIRDLRVPKLRPIERTTTIIKK